MPRDLDDIVNLYNARRVAHGEAYTRMLRSKEHYEGTVEVPLPELDRTEEVAVPNLVTQGIDQLGMRINSTNPNVIFPPLRPGVKASENKARDRRAATLGWFDANELDIKDGRRARHLVSYACTPVEIGVDRRHRMPRWTTLNPLCTLPAPAWDYDDMLPEDCIVEMTRDRAWLEREYPEQLSMLKKRSEDDTFTVLKYVDADQKVLILLSDPEHYDTSQKLPGWNQWNRVVPIAGPTMTGTEHAVVLASAPNLADRCTIVVPGRITLDEAIGQFDSMLGMFTQQAKLMALEVNAVMRGVYPDTWLVARQGERAEIVTMADGLQGIVGQVEGGDIKVVNENPGYKTTQTIDMLERNQRVTARIPSEWGGESPTNIRTGRRGENVLSAVVDHTIQEAQRILARSRKHEIEIAVALQKSVYGSKRLWFYPSKNSGTVTGRGDYTPNDTFEDANVIVAYSSAGSDINQLTIIAGQLQGTGMMSNRTAMEMHPLIDDPEQEQDRMIVEGLRSATLAALQNRAANGEIPESDLARLEDLIITNKMELREAIQQVQREAQERQAEVVEPGAPEAQPGLANPGVGAEQPIAPPGAIPEVGQDTQDLASLFSNLRRPAMTIAAERGPAA